MKSYAKVSLLFALIIMGRYLQPAVTNTTLAPQVVSNPPALPLVLTRYAALASVTPTAQPQALQAARGYFM